MTDTFLLVLLMVVVVSVAVVALRAPLGDDLDVEDSYDDESEWFV